MEEELEGGKMRIMKEVTATETGSQSSEQTTAGMLLGLCVDTNLDIQVNKSIVHIMYNFRQSNNVTKDKTPTLISTSTRSSWKPC